jgi:hypothetical protein
LIFLPDPQNATVAKASSTRLAVPCVKIPMTCADPPRYHIQRPKTNHLAPCTRIKPNR